MKLTTRGKRVRAVIFIALTLWLTTKVATNLWWIDGYCWGSYEKCYQVEGEGK